MKKQTVYMCKNGHLYYGKECPQQCKYCGSKEFGLITVDDMEGDNGVSEESGNNSN